VFLPTLSFLCFFYFMLICQLAIGGQKGGGFCHHRIEVTLITKFYHRLVHGPPPTIMAVALVLYIDP
jgi:hypothetical protein